MKHLIIITLFCSLALSPEVRGQAEAAGPQPGQPEIVLDRIAAVVNDGVVLESELNRQLRIITRNLAEQRVEMPPPGMLRRQVLESLILKRIQLQRIERLGMTISDEELNRSLQLLAQQNGLAFGDLPAALASQGLDYAAYREELREQMALEQLRLRDVNSRVTITRNEVDKIMATSAPDNLEYEVLHLLIATGSDASEDKIEEARLKAEELYTRLENGEAFGALAIAYSNAPGVLLNRGNLGYLRADALPSIFAEKVLTMSPGQISPPIKSPSGFHIVQLNDIRGIEKVMTEQRLARHILIKTNEVVNDEQARQKLENILERLRAGEDFADIAKRESDDPTTANAGGELDWAAPGNFVPEFESTLARLKKNEISEPFRSPFGWHIVQLLDVREHDATQDVRLNQAAVALRERKIQEETQTWITQLRDEAYVEIRLDDLN